MFSLYFDSMKFPRWLCEINCIIYEVYLKWDAPEVMTSVNILHAKNCTNGQTFYKPLH